MYVGSIQKDWKITFGKCESEMLPRSLQEELSQKQNEAFRKEKVHLKKILLFYTDKIMELD